MKLVVAESGLFYASYIALWLLLLMNTLGVLLLFRHFGLTALATLEGVQRQGLGIGETAPDVVGVNARGEALRWRPEAGWRSMLLFASPDCGPCQEVFPYISDLARNTEGSFVVATIVSGPRENAARVSEMLDPAVMTIADDGSGAFDAYATRVTPFAFTVGEEGRIRAKGLCGNPIRLRDLLRASAFDDLAEILEPLISRDMKIDLQRRRDGKVERVAQEVRP